VVARNLLTTTYTCKYVRRHMRERRSGKIVNVGSIAGHVAVQEGIIYAAAKAAVVHYTHCLAEQQRPARSWLLAPAEPAQLPHPGRHAGRGSHPC
jgi:3-oxoacyl-[acyl-carrier protein] reductase